MIFLFTDLTRDISPGVQVLETFRVGPFGGTPGNGDSRYWYFGSILSTACQDGTSGYVSRRCLLARSAYPASILSNVEVLSLVRVPEWPFS